MPEGEVGVGRQAEGVIVMVSRAGRAEGDEEELVFDLWGAG